MKFSAEPLLNSHHAKIPKIRRQNIYISDKSRLIMLILIKKYSLSCYLAARILDIPYENAKQIYRGLRKENRIVWNNPNGSHDIYKMLMFSHIKQFQDEAKCILMEALRTDKFTLA